MKKCEFCDMSLEDLGRKEAELRKELAGMTIKKRVNQIEKTHLFKSLKKDVARIMTFRRQKAEK